MRRAGRCVADAAAAMAGAGRVPCPVRSRQKRRRRVRGGAESAVHGSSGRRGRAPVARADEGGCRDRRGRVERPVYGRPPTPPSRNAISSSTPCSAPGSPVTWTGSRRTWCNGRTKRDGPILAVDIPSGIDSDTGLVRGAAIRAARTVTFAARKPGHLLYPGRGHCGPVEVAEIGIAAEWLQGSGLVVNGPDLWTSVLPQPAPSGHKIRSRPRGRPVGRDRPIREPRGWRHAARSGAGAGLVTLVTSARALAVNAAHLTAIMLKVADDPDELSDMLTDDRFNALALGAGARGGRADARMGRGRARGRPGRPCSTPTRSPASRARPTPWRSRSAPAGSTRSC